MIIVVDGDGVFEDVFGDDVIVVDVFDFFEDFDVGCI